ncbi:hypothetical protein [Ilumatobacter coccineus]|nr:hypothetical protein [Ilumatobacter coccineus]
MIAMNTLSRLLPARKRRTSTFDAPADTAGQRRTGDPRLDLGIIERRWQV